MSERRGRREKLMCIGEAELVELFLKAHDKYRRAWFEGVPDDAEVGASIYSLDRRCWLVSLRHPSFDVVPEGQIAPMVWARVEWISVNDRIAELEERLTEETRRRREAEARRT